MVSTALTTLVVLTADTRGFWGRHIDHVVVGAVLLLAAVWLLLLSRRDR